MGSALIIDRRFDVIYHLYESEYITNHVLFSELYKINLKAWRLIIMQSSLEGFIKEYLIS